MHGAPPFTRGRRALGDAAPRRRGRSPCTSAAAPRAARGLSATAATLIATESGYDLVIRRKGGRPARAPRPFGRRDRGASRARRATIVRRREAGAREARYDYEKDGAAIYRQSFAIIRRRSRSRALLRSSRSASRSGSSMPAAWSRRRATSSSRLGAAEAAERALRAGAPIFCDARMVAEGVTRARLPASNDVDLHARRSFDAQHWPKSSARPARRRRSTSGCRDSPARSSPSATRRRPSFGSSNSSPPAAHARPRSSACRSASSARPNRRRR